MNYKKVAAIIVCIVLIMGMTSCKQTPSSSTNSKADAVITLDFPCFQIGASVSAPAMTAVLDEFQKQYAGQIKLNIEGLPSDTEYTNKMKILASSNQLPDVIDGKNGVRPLAIKNGQAVELTPYLEADAKWKAEIGQDDITANTTDGKVYSLSNNSQTIGYFYNKDMFTKAGITPATTWDDFMSNLDKLKKAGFTPLAMMTGENSWTTNLILASIIGTDGAEGNAYMNTTYPATYNNAHVIKGLTLIQKMLKDYSTKDSVGAMYANAANDFEQEKCAIIANGSWMVPDFSNTAKSTAGLQNRVGVAIYPENGTIQQYDIGYILCKKANEDPKRIEAASKLFKFLTGAYTQQVYLYKTGALPTTSNIVLTDDFKKNNPLIMDTIALQSQAKYKYKDIDITAYASVVDAFGKLYPELAFGTITPEQMATGLTQAAAQSK